MRVAWLIGEVQPIVLDRLLHQKAGVQSGRPAAVASGTSTSRPVLQS